MIYSKIGGGREGGAGAYSRGLNSPPSPNPPPPPVAKFASQGDAHMRTDAQINFLYYTLSEIPVGKLAI